MIHSTACHETKSVTIGTCNIILLLYLFVIGVHFKTCFDVWYVRGANAKRCSLTWYVLKKLGSIGELH